jgi:hypothetical protein
MATEAHSNQQRNSKREIWFGLLTVIISTVFCLLLAEYGLRWYQQSINNSSAGDPGLLRYHPRLGWTLTPSWQGRHQHHDFDVHYNINKYGFRGDFPEDLKSKSKVRIAVVGDSFSFGLGVNNEDVFTAQLNQRQTAVEFLNLSVPGYSTDQQLLLMETTGTRFIPDEYILVVYLANDILDNMLPYPLQTDQAKPFFSLDDKQQLILENVPTPQIVKPATLRSMTLNTVIFGDSLKSFESNSILQDSQLLQRLLPRKASAGRETVFKLLDQRLSQQKLLMKALLIKINSYTTTNDRRLRIALLSGSSFILSPESYSAYYQDYVRLLLIETSTELNIPVIDIANKMRSIKTTDSVSWFHPNEGHLTQHGHRLVSDILVSALDLE